MAKRQRNRDLNIGECYCHHYANKKIKAHGGKAIKVFAIVIILSLEVGLDMIFSIKLYPSKLLRHALSFMLPRALWV